MAEQKEEKTRSTRVTGIRLTESERAELKRLGNGSFTLAIRDALDAWFRKNRVKPAN